MKWKWNVTIWKGLGSWIFNSHIEKGVICMHATPMLVTRYKEVQLLKIQEPCPPFHMVTLLNTESISLSLPLPLPLPSPLSIPSPCFLYTCSTSPSSFQLEWVATCPPLERTVPYLNGCQRTVLYFKMSSIWWSVQSKPDLTIRSIRRESSRGFEVVWKTSSTRAAD